MPAAARRERDDRGYVLRILARQRQRTPRAGRMADDDDAIRPDEGLLAHKPNRGGNLVRRGAAGFGIIRLVAAALILEVLSAGRTMTRAFRNQHGKTARHQPRRERAVFGLRHLGASQDVLGGGVRDHGQRKRSITRRPEQHRMRRGRKIGRGHQPLLQAIGRPFGALRAEAGLRCTGLHTEHSKDGHCKKHVWRMHELA